MSRWIRITLVTLTALALLAGAAVFGAVQNGERKQHRLVALDVRPVPYADDATSLQRGRYLFLSRGCTECHGVDGRGKDVINDGKGMLVHAPNITSVPNGITAAYREADWVRLIRHGVKHDGRPAMVMPSEDYARLTDADLAALVAWVRRLPAAEGPGATVQFPLVVRALYGTGVIRDAADKIDHTLPPSAPVPDAATAAHGAYVANACIGCHGAALSGGRIPGTPPDWPPAANLTPAADGALAKYPDVAAFQAMLRTGKRPDGSVVSPVMPFAALKELNDTDVQAIWLHLKALPATATGVGR
jgi:mono/diheme cytochrome c family protein